MSAKSSPTVPSLIAILGCGRVGKAFAGALLAGNRRPRYSGRLVLWSRNRRSAKGVSQRLHALGVSDSRSRIAPGLSEAVEGAQVILLCVAEGAYEATLSALEGALTETPRKSRRGGKPVLLIASGCQELGPLLAHHAARFSIGRLHPLAPVPRTFRPGTFRLDPFGIEGDGAARRVARQLLRFWEGQSLELDGAPGRASTYHAGAALLGGGLVALYSLAESVMAPTVRSRRELARALARFCWRNTENAASMGPTQALTGPVARGSEATVRAHLEALRGAPEALAAYRVLGTTMLSLARAGASIDENAARTLRRCLAAPRRKG